MRRKLMIYTLIMSMLAWGGIEIWGSPVAVAQTKTINVKVSAMVPPIFEVRATPREFQSEQQAILLDKEPVEFNTVSSSGRQPKIIRERKPDKILYTVYTL